MSSARSVIVSDLLPASLDPDNIVAENPWSLVAAIVNSCDDAIISKDLNGIITSWNAAAQRMFGYRPDEVIGKSIMILIPKDLHGEEAELLRMLRAGNRIDHHETIRLAKDGSLLQISLTISPIRDNSGTIIGASKIARDISERRSTEEMRSRLASIVESSDDAIVSKSLDGIVTSWNEAAVKMFGYRPEEMIGQSILKIIPEELRSEETDILRRIRAGDRIDHIETTRLAKDGSRLDVSLTISPIRDESGRLIGASKIARDISVRKKMESMLFQSEKVATTGRMAATIAHEINNPLEAVMNLVFLARQSCPPESEAHRYLLTAESEVERVSRIARSTLGYYRDQGKASELFLRDVVEAALEVFAAKLSSRGITIESSYCQNRSIVAKKGEMIQVFSNIISNSIDAMPHGGQLHIHVVEAAGTNGDCLQVTVEDTGSGIEEQHLARVFEPFYTTKPDVGTGIGLWVTKRMIESRGGQISISSCTTPGSSGSKITIELPYTG